MENRELEQLIDALGAVRGEIEVLKAREKQLRSQLIKTGAQQGAGRWYRFKLVHSQRRIMDYPAILAKLQPSVQLLTAHTRTIETDALHIKPLKNPGSRRENHVNG